MIRVLVADDEPLIRAGIRTVLESAGDIVVVAEAADGRTAAGHANDVDVALLDIRMPLLDGLDALQALHSVRPELPVVILTSFGIEQNVARALQRGAAGFLLKNCTPGELIRAVRAARDGDAYLSPEVTRHVFNLVGPEDAERRSAARRRLAVLTPKESDVLRLVAEGLSNAEIGGRLRMSETSIKTYVSRILTKLGCANRVQAALMQHDLL